ncbi:MAG: IS110 family transposase [Arcobacter sp.]|nr:IS110 family transposase [Arcobacter sp.]
MYQDEISVLEQEIFSLLDKHGITKQDCHIEQKDNSLITNLKSIHGVAQKTIAAVISECGDLTRFPTTTKFIGYLGLFPTENSSGNYVSTGHLSKRGSSIAKQALYMSSVSCLLHNPELKRYYDIKRSQGKSKQEALIAVSRKLATIIYSIFKHNIPYDPNRVFAKS